MVPSGLSQHDGLVDKGKRVWTEKGGNYKRVTPQLIIILNANPLHMNAHSFGNNCNQYVFTQCVVVISDGIVSPSVGKFIRASLCFPKVLRG